MSTKSSIASGPDFHLYCEVFDNANVYLDLEGAQFEASNHHVMVAIPFTIWEVIRHHSPVDLSFADKTDDEIRRLVESEVLERSQAFAADERKESILKFSGVFVYGSADDPPGEQIAKGMEHFMQLRSRQSKLRQDIEDLRNLQQHSRNNALSSNAEPLNWLDQLPHAPASDVKKLGWRGLLKTIPSGGKLVVTNHNEPEAVILTATAYADLMRAAQQAAAQTEGALATLRERFNQRLAALQSPDAGDRLRDVMRAGARLEGKVKAGASH